jgi:hypothetical protein
MKEELSMSYYPVKEEILSPSFGICLQYRCGWYKLIRLILISHMMSIGVYSPVNDTVISNESYSQWAVRFLVLHQWYSRQCVRLTTHVAAHAKIQNEWSYTFTPSYAFMAHTDTTYLYLYQQWY